MLYRNKECTIPNHDENNNSMNSVVNLRCTETWFCFVIINMAMLFSSQLVLLIALLLLSGNRHEIVLLAYNIGKFPLINNTSGKWYNKKIYSIHIPWMVVYLPVVIFTLLSSYALRRWLQYCYDYNCGLI